MDINKLVLHKRCRFRNPSVKCESSGELRATTCFLLPSLEGVVRDQLKRITISYIYAIHKHRAPSYAVSYGTRSGVRDVAVPSPGCPCDSASLQRNSTRGYFM